MAFQHHFVVIVEEDGTSYIDYDTSVNFDCGEVWDDNSEMWFSRNDDEVVDSYEQASTLLSNLLEQTRKK